MINKVTLIGNLGADPDCRTTPAGKAVTEFRLATKNYDDTSEWHRIIAWDKLGEVAGKYLTKGKMAYVEGRIQTRSYDKDGEKKYVTEIVANEIKFLSPKGDTVKVKLDSTSAEEDDLPF